MGLFDSPQKLDDIVSHNWPGPWIRIDISSETAHGYHPFNKCAQDILAEAKKVKVKLPIAIGLTKEIQLNEDTWMGSIRLAWPATTSLDTMRHVLLTWDLLHNKHKMGSVVFGDCGVANSIGEVIKFCNVEGKIWRFNFKCPPRSG